MKIKLKHGDKVTLKEDAHFKYQQDNLGTDFGIIDLNTKIKVDWAIITWTNNYSNHYPLSQIELWKPVECVKVDFKTLREKI